MKFVEGIVITEIKDKKVAICTGDAINIFRGFINLNDSAYEIWQCISKGMSIDDIAQYLSKEYSSLTYEEAFSYINDFVLKLKEKGILID